MLPCSTHTSPLLAKKLREMGEFSEDELRMIDLLEEQLKVGRTEMKVKAKGRESGIDLNEIL